MTVDMFKDGPFSEKDFEPFQKRGWKVIFGKGGGKTGLADNQMRGLQEAENEFVLTCEDDSFIRKIPDIHWMQYLIDDYCVPILLYNANVWSKKPESPKVVDYINNPNNYYQIGNDCVLLKENIFDKRYMISFPAIITFKDMLIYLHKKARELGGHRAIEIGLSQAHQQLSKPEQVGIYLKNIELPVTAQDLHDNAQITYWNNDRTLRHPTLKNKAHIWI